jgi:hypothetical protein
MAACAKAIIYKADGFKMILTQQALKLDRKCSYISNCQSF